MLTSDRNTPQALGDIRSGGVAAATTVFAGSIAMRNAAGFLTKGATAAGLVGVGRAEERVANAGADGAAELKYRAGIFRFANAAAGDAVTTADIGEPVFAVDDETVAATDGGGTRSIAGFVDHLDDQGVWVRFDEVAARTYLAATAA
jgi:hypothetical protein